jgi:hypothetical protein
MSASGTERKLESGCCWAFLWSVVERLAAVGLYVMGLTSYGGS